MISADATIMRDSEVATAAVNDEVFMLSIRLGTYFGFNGTGSEIWRLLAQPRRVSELYEALSTIFDADIESITRETSPFLQTLLDRRLVRIVDAGAPK